MGPQSVRGGDDGDRAPVWEHPWMDPCRRAPGGVLLVLSIDDDDAEAVQAGEKEFLLQPPRILLPLPPMATYHGDHRRIWA